MAEPTPEEIPFNVSCFCGYRGLVCDHIYSAATGETRQGVEHEIRAAVAAETERCAKIAESFSPMPLAYPDRELLAAAIRRAPEPGAEEEK